MTAASHICSPSTETAALTYCSAPVHTRDSCFLTAWCGPSCGMQEREHALHSRTRSFVITRPHSIKLQQPGEDCGTVAVQLS